MNKEVILSIVIPTLGNFSDSWLEQLLRINGDVEFLIVYPPGVKHRNVSDSRVKLMEGSCRSELDQRMTGLLNASGKYVLALDDDDYAHTEVVELVVKYFKRFPESWVLRLRAEDKALDEGEPFIPHWQDIPEIDKLGVCSLNWDQKGLYKFANKDKQLFRKDKILSELPIAPVKKSFDKRWLFWPFNKRIDQNGCHIENFNNKIWKKKIVHEALMDLAENLKLIGSLKIMPKGRCGFDRVLGLYLQAKFYNERKVIGHWMPVGRSQIIKTVYRKKILFALSDRSHHFSSHLILIKRFPSFGYFWNLLFSVFWGIPRYFIKSILYKWRILN